MSTFTSAGMAVTVEVFSPAAAGLHPAVLVAYGTRGMNPPFGQAIRDSADDLARAGYLVLIPHYFERTGTAASTNKIEDLAVLEAFSSHRNDWLSTLRDCEDYAAGRSDVDRTRVGLLGYSMGGHLVLLRAASSSGLKPKAVIEFFAPIDMPPFFSASGSQLTRAVAQLPPAQIHHGVADSIVPVAQSVHLANLLRGAGKVEGSGFELYQYPGEDHGFQGPTPVASSRQRTAAFFGKHL